MNKRVIFRIAALVAVLMMVGCGSYNKLLKRNNPDEMFYAAID